MVIDDIIQSRFDSISAVGIRDQYADGCATKVSHAFMKLLARTRIFLFSVQLRLPPHISSVGIELISGQIFAAYSPVPHNFVSFDWGACLRYDTAQSQRA